MTKIFDDRRLYRIAEAARIWGVSRNTMYAMMREYPYIVKKIKRRGARLLVGEKLNMLYYG